MVCSVGSLISKFIDLALVQAPSRRWQWCTVIEPDSTTTTACTGAGWTVRCDRAIGDRGRGGGGRRCVTPAHTRNRGPPDGRRWLFFTNVLCRVSALFLLFLLEFKWILMFSLVPVIAIQSGGRCVDEVILDDLSEFATGRSWRRRHSRWSLCPGSGPSCHCPRSPRSREIRFWSLTWNPSTARLVRPARLVSLLTVADASAWPHRRRGRTYTRT